MMLPLPPWCFPNARVMYQPSFLPVDASKAAIPSLSKKKEKSTRGSATTCTSSFFFDATAIDDEDGDEADSYRRPPNYDNLALISLFGWTLGGLFVVDWTESPIGPYREVAVLSGLVVQENDWFGGIGAWASHIVVTTEDAAAGGRDLFGLPTVLGSIDFSPCDDGSCETPNNEININWIRDAVAGVAAALKYAAGTATPGIAEPAEILNKGRMSSGAGGRLGGSCVLWYDEDRVSVKGWNGWSTNDGNQRFSDVGGDAAISSTTDTAIIGGGISLPSFSGRLPLLASTAGYDNDDDYDCDKRSPLLKYPLRLVKADSIRLRSPMVTVIAPGANMNKKLGSVLSMGRAASTSSNGDKDESSSPASSAVIPVPFCIQVDGVLVVAGEPEEIG